MSRCSADRGSSIGLFHVGPNKFKACKSVLFTEGSLKKLKYLNNLGQLHTLKSNVRVVLHHTLWKLRNAQKDERALCINVHHGRKLGRTICYFLLQAALHNLPKKNRPKISC